MIDRVCIHRFYKRALIHDLREMGQQFGDVHPRIAVLLEFEWRTHAEQILLTAGHCGDALSLSHAIWKILARHFGQLRLWIKQVQLRWSSGHKQIDDAFRTWLAMQCPQCTWYCHRAIFVARESRWVQQTGEP